MNTYNAIIMWYYSLLSRCISSLFLALFEMKSWVSKTCLQRTARLKIEDDKWWVKTAWPNNQKCHAIFILAAILRQILTVHVVKANVSCLSGFEADVIMLCPSLPCIDKIRATLTDATWLLEYYSCAILNDSTCACLYWMSLLNVFSLHIKWCTKKINTKIQWPHSNLMPIPLLIPVL